LKIVVFLATALLSAASASANDWEKFYRPAVDPSLVIPSTVEAEQVPFTGNIEQDSDAMWRRGFIAIGYSYFNSANSKTKDALRLAKKLKARFVAIATELTSSETRSVPITTPTTSTTFSSGRANVTGSRGSATGNYSGTSTTTGTQTTYFPMTVNRFDKLAIYYAEVPKNGLGALTRELNAQEVAQFETRRGFVVRSVRDGSPAYNADVLPGDIVLKINGLPADSAAWEAAMQTNQSIKIDLHRKGSMRQIEVTVPADWR
jgi:hypothetical protein